MSLKKDFIHSINNLINYNDNYIILGSNLDFSWNNYEDLLITETVRISDGLWSEKIKTNKILPIVDKRGYLDNKLEIGNSKTKLDINGLDINIGNFLNTEININGSNILIGQENTVLKLNEISNLIELGTLNTESTILYGCNFNIKSDNIFKINESFIIENTNILLTTNKFAVNNENSNTYLNIENDSIVIKSSNLSIINDISEINTISNIIFSVGDKTNINISKEDINIRNENNVNILTNILKINTGPLATNFEINNREIILGSDTISNIYSIAENISLNKITDKTSLHINKITGSINNYFENNLNFNNLTDNVYLFMDNISKTIIINADDKIINNTNFYNINTNFIVDNSSSNNSVSINTPSFFFNQNIDDVNFIISEGKINFNAESNIILNSSTVLINSSLNTIIESPLYEINRELDNTYIKVDNTLKNIQIGTTKTKKINLYSEKINSISSISTILTTPIFEINNSSSNAYIKIDKIFGKIQIGSESTLQTIINGISITNNALLKESHNTPIFEINSISDSAYLKLDKNTNLLNLNNSILLKKLDIPEINIYGNIKTYGNTSNENILLNSLPVDNAAFSINNLGRDIALVVSQHNLDTIDKDIVQFLTVYNKAALRIDGLGNIGLNIEKNSNIEALFHIVSELSNLNPILKIESRNAQDNSDSNIEAVGQESSFIIQSNGNIGIGLDNPLYKLHVEGDINYTGILYKNNIDILSQANIEVTKLQHKTQYLEANSNSVEFTNGLINFSIDAETIILGNEESTIHILGDLIIKQQLYKDSSSNNDIITFLRNDDLSVFRIDNEGHVGLGVNSDSNINAWLHIIKADQTDINYDLFRIDDKINDLSPFIIKNNGFVGIGKIDPLYNLDIKGDIRIESNIITNSLITGIIAKEYIKITDAFIFYQFIKDENIKNYGTDTELFLLHIFNFNKRIIDISSDLLYNTQNNLMIWYKFEPNNDIIFNHANFNDLLPISLNNNSSNTNNIENIDIINIKRGNQQNYALYINPDMILDKGKAYVYMENPIEFLNKISNNFSINFWIRTEDQTLETCSIFQIKFLSNKLIDIKIENNGKLSIFIEDIKGNNIKKYSIGNILERKITNINIGIDKINKILLIHLNSILDSEISFNLDLDFNYYTTDIKILIGTDISIDQSDIYIEFIKFFDRLINQGEIYGINDYDEDGKRDKTVKINPDENYLLDINGNLMIRNTLYINNDHVYKMLYTIGGALYTDTNSQSKCTTSIIIKWSNDVSNDIDVNSYIFRLACKFHISGISDIQPIAYRKFEIFISPINSSTSPVEIITTEITDTVHSSFILLTSQLERKDDNTGLLNIKWKNLDNINNSARAYMEIDVLAHVNLGIFTFDPFIEVEGEGLVTL